MNKLLLVLMVSVGLFLSGCATMEGTKNEADLEKKLSEAYKENGTLKAEIDQKDKIIQSLKEEVKKGSHMPTGEEIQTALTNAGLYSGKVDGVIGSDTTEAIRKFQQASGLNSDGVVGSRTWDKLKEHLVDDKSLEKTLEVKN